MRDVFFYEAFKEEEAALKNFLPKGVRAGFSWKTIQEKKDTVVPARVISIRTQSRLPEGWSKKVEAVFSRSQGFDHLAEYKNLTGSGVPCGYLMDYCSYDVAEHAFLMAMMLLRKMNKQQKQFLSFDRDDITGRQIKDKKALVVGVGKIGTHIVEIAKKMEMRVRGVDIERRIKKLSYVSLDKGVSWADVVFCALPLTSKTEGLLSYGLMKKAENCPVLINVSRGEITPTEDLNRLLRERKISGLGLDVFDNEKALAEKFRKNSLKLTGHEKMIKKLSQHDNVIFTPHNAFNTQEAVEEKAKQTIGAIKQFFLKKKFPHQV